MNGVNKTLYIPLYGKAQVSKKGLLLRDPKAEEIWAKEQFILKGKARSKWLTYFMAMRAKVFDDWTVAQMERYPEAVVLHIGCGMDSRVLRVGEAAKTWYDVDFPAVIAERKKYYTENERYHMLGADASQTEWISRLPRAACALVILEGISMYLPNESVAQLFGRLQEKYKKVFVLMDVYTILGAKASKYKNPINEVGVSKVYGIASPETVLTNHKMHFIKEHPMTPKPLVARLPGIDRWFFRFLFAGRATQKIYRLFEYELGSKP